MIATAIIKEGVVHAIKWQLHTASANQLRLFLHAGAYWMMWHLRALMPRLTV